MDDVVVLVTGAASGIGRATALRLCNDGATVLAIDRDSQGLATLVEESRQLPSLISSLEVDLCDRSSYAYIADTSIDRFGRIDALVNNAGVMQDATIAETSLAQWDHMLEVNLTALMGLSRECLPALIGSGRGVIVNVSSAAGLVGLKRRAAYCATKAGVVGLTRAMAADHAREGLRVIAVCPGTVETPWLTRLLGPDYETSQGFEEMKARQVDGQVGQPEEVASLIAYLVRPESRFINGAAIAIDGGLTAV